MEYFNGLFALDVATTSTLFSSLLCVFLFFFPPFSKSIVKTRFSPDLKIIFTCFNRAPITRQENRVPWNRCLRGWDTRVRFLFAVSSFLLLQEWNGSFNLFFPPSVFAGLTDWRSISVINFALRNGAVSTANLHN